MSVTDDIKSRLDIVQYISQIVPLKKAGRNLTACCPFHHEKTPSFVVFPERQSWHCFGACATGGDIFTFVMKHENIDFPAALISLAERAGVEIKPRSDDQRRIDERIERLRGVVDQTAVFYHQLLWDAPEAAHARDYVLKRGLSEATIAQFKLGYAPRDWAATLNHLKMLGYTAQDVMDAGCASQNDEGRVYDRFRDRLMIPIHDERGRAIGFGARALNPEDTPKYLNSPQSEGLFDKSRTLFALHHARPTIRESEVAVIVEGYMDAITAHQAKFTNVVAQMGTALTKPQLKLLSQYAKRLILALDADAAGVRATMRGLNVMQEASETKQVFFDPTATLRQASHFDLAIEVITIPEGKDPDEVIRKDPATWQTLIEMAQPVAEYLIQVGTAHLRHDAPLPEREQAARELLPILIATENDLQRQANVQQLAYKLRLGSGRALLEWALQNVPNERVKAQPQRSPAAFSAPTEVAAGGEGQAKSTFNVNRAAERERYCIAALLQAPERLALANRRLREAEAAPLDAEDFTQGDYRAIYLTLREGVDQDDVSISEFLAARLPDLRELIEDLRETNLAHLQRRLERGLHGDWVAVLNKETRVVATLNDVEALKTSLGQHILELRRLHLRRQNTELQYLQQDLQRDGQQATPTDTPQTGTFEGQIAVNASVLARIERAMRH
ncbi:MAG TPA: DNA primase [Aggregatilineales bacterium]|nr:DNA primase [Anaerolineales bacterium]HRE48050.1 DNA primase [Aggregatilineales bacterium]